MKHILFDLKGCSADLLNDARHVRNSLFHASILSNSKILKIDYHEFTPQGVTGFALLAESHLSIHTWPEKGIAKCDIFCCSDKSKPKEAVEYLHRRFKSQEVRRWVCDRSSKIITVL